jgi:hypothetical protein
MNYVYNGVEYTSYKALAEAVGVTAPTLKKYINEEGSIEQAIQKLEKNVQEKEVYVYQGVEYSSVLQLFNATKIERKILTRLLQTCPRDDRRILTDDVVDNYLNREKTTYTYKGITYNLIGEAAKAVNLNPATLSKYLKLANNDMEKAMALYEKEHTYAIVDGRRFSSAVELSEYLEINPITLRKYINQEGSVEGAVKRAIKKNTAMVWNGNEYFSLESLAIAMDIPRPTLKRYVEQYNGDIDKAYEAYQKRNSGKYRGYIYEGKEYSSLENLLNDIGISKTVYNRAAKSSNGDWKSTIERILEQKKLRQEKQEIKRKAKAEKDAQREAKRTDYIYEGKVYHTIKELSLVTGIYGKKLAYLLKEYDNNLDVALKAQEENVLYRFDDKSFKSIYELSKYTGIIDTRLGRYLKRYDGDAEKAIFMIRLADSRMKEIELDETNLTTQDLAIVLGIKHMELLSMLNSGKTIEEIRKEIPQKKEREFVPRGKVHTINGESLSEYCTKHRINYSCIYYLIKTYGKTPEEAIANYKRSGQKVPESWIFEKYGVLLKHLLLNEGISSKKIVEMMRANGISFKDAIENYIVDEKAKEDKLDRYWMREVYSFLNSEYLSDTEKQDFEKTFMINAKEKLCIEKAKEKIDEVERKLLLTEILTSIRDKDFSEKEMVDLMILYGITQDEIKTMFLDFDADFNDKILLADNQTEKQNKLQIKSYVENWEDFSEEEKSKVKQNVSESEYEYIITTSENIKKYQQAVGDAKIIKVMRENVGRNVETNAEIRTELKTRSSIENTKE